MRRAVIPRLVYSRQRVIEAHCFVPGTDFCGQGVHPLQAHGLVGETECSQRLHVVPQHADPGLNAVCSPPRRNQRVGGVLCVTRKVAIGLSNPGLLLGDPGPVPGG